MGVLVLKDPYFSWNTVDLSDKVRQITLNYSADIQDATAGNSAGVHAKLGGLTDWSVNVEFNQDFAAGEVDATLFADVGVSRAIEIRSQTAAVSATNPSFTGSALLSSYPPISGNIGQTLTSAVQLEGTGALTRATS